MKSCLFRSSNLWWLKEKLCFHCGIRVHWYERLEGECRRQELKVLLQAGWVLCGGPTWDIIFVCYVGWHGILLANMGKGTAVNHCATDCSPYHPFKVPYGSPVLMGDKTKLILETPHWTMDSFFLSHTHSPAPQ